MAEATKYSPIGAASNNNLNLGTDLKTLFPVLKTRRAVTFAYAFTIFFVAVTIFLAFSPSQNASSPWFTNIFSSSTLPTAPSSYKSQLSSVFSYFFNTTSSNGDDNNNNPFYPPDPFTNTTSSFTSTSRSANATSQTHDNTTRAEPLQPATTTLHNTTLVTSTTTNNSSQSRADTFKVKPPPLKQESDAANHTSKTGGAKVETTANLTSNAVSAPAPAASHVPVGTPHQNLSSGSAPVKANYSVKGVVSGNYTASLAKKQSYDELMESLAKCDFFHGEWVKDDSYPLYKPGSCPLIDEQFNCIGNGRPDKDYQKYKWKPKDCTLPRMDAHRMLDLLRGKRLVFVGDSLNRNMWESMICILRNAVKDKKKVYEVNGRVHFRGEASYSFIFKDYNFTVELFVSPFLVQEWEVPDKNGTKKETLRLDLVGRSSDQYKDADIIVFNTGHWWTHDKTSKGKDYYQEGSHVYNELNVLEAFRRAITTWSRWVDAKVNPSKSMVFFRGYSASHFSGGQWNSGGACDSETVPIDNEKYLTEYPPKMRVLEKVLQNMKTHVSYLNITRMTDFRKDGHPSIYRKQNLSPEERKSPLRFQDCSHWCLPGVPDAWNEILYAELLVRQYKKKQQQKKA
ncbi:hypothetical protein HN51_015308 [Arachis hypogaea]|uniref:Uncharacterized protein n=1 Tax=Arachis hypogaea TaxID=3818 RepID=A0A445CL58_ARAHY|nr:protein trichome birefringence [Arachis hypogaea]QHO44640.1 Protein trichome birefringence [Arachis hypogaea]RYR51647.1 hypothetical protein Ahy_A06g026621 [Arachis hypogaea]